jgi:hypothetical protein
MSEGPICSEDSVGWADMLSSNTCASQILTFDAPPTKNSGWGLGLNLGRPGAQQVLGLEFGSQLADRDSEAHGALDLGLGFEFGGQDPVAHGALGRIAASLLDLATRRAVLSE